MMSIDQQTVPGDVFEMLEMTNKTAEEVFSLLDNLLKWTKSQLGKLSNVPQPIDMVGLVDGVIEVFKPIAQSKSISLELNSEIEFVNVIIDIEMIKSVVRNLISNAIKFSHKDTVVMVHVKVQDITNENATGEGNGKEVSRQGDGSDRRKRGGYCQTAADIAENEKNYDEGYHGVPKLDRNQDDGVGCQTCHRRTDTNYFRSFGKDEERGVQA